MHSDGVAPVSESDVVEPDERIELTVEGQRLLQRLLAEASRDAETDESA